MPGVMSWPDGGRLLQRAAQPPAWASAHTRPPPPGPPGRRDHAALTLPARRRPPPPQAPAARATATRCGARARRPAPAAARATSRARSAARTPSAWTRRTRAGGGGRRCPVALPAPPGFPPPTWCAPGGRGGGGLLQGLAARPAAGGARSEGPVQRTSECSAPRGQCRQPLAAGEGTCGQPPPAGRLSPPPSAVLLQVVHRVQGRQVVQRPPQLLRPHLRGRDPADGCAGCRLGAAAHRPRSARQHVRPPRLGGARRRGYCCCCCSCKAREPAPQAARSSPSAQRPPSDLAAVYGRAEPHNLRIVHPAQDRVLSIRENARGQVGGPRGGGGGRGGGGRAAGGRCWRPSFSSTWCRACAAAAPAPDPTLAPPAGRASPTTTSLCPAPTCTCSSWARTPASSLSRGVARCRWRSATSRWGGGGGGERGGGGRGGGGGGRVPPAWPQAGDRPPSPALAKPSRVAAACRSPPLSAAQRRSAPPPPLPQIGNAVAPPMAKGLGRCLLLALEGRSPAGAAVVSVPDPELLEVGGERAGGGRAGGRAGGPLLHGSTQPHSSSSSSRGCAGGRSLCPRCARAGGQSSGG
jgi:hypothetical protein